MKTPIKLLLTTALKYVCICGLMFNVNFLFAQENEEENKPDMQFGFKAGASLSNLHKIDDAKQEEMIVGWHGGVLLKVPLTKYFAIQPELLYSTKGARLTLTRQDIDITARNRLYYFDLPVMAYFKITDNVNFQLGPYFSYLFSVITTDQTLLLNYNPEDELTRKNFKKVDYGFVTGLGLDFQTIGFGARYNIGMVEIGKERIVFGEPFSFGSARNNVIQAYMEIKF